MLTTRLRFTIASVLLLTLIAGCTPDPKHVADNPFCAKGEDVNESCRYEAGDTSFWLLSSNQRMPAERPIQLILRSTKPLQIEASELRGLSMYMGRIPLQWEEVSNREWRTIVHVGACTDPDMRWQLRLSLSTDDGSYQRQLPFSSIQP